MDLVLHYSSQIPIYMYVIPLDIVPPSLILCSSNFTTVLMFLCNNHIIFVIEGSASIGSFFSSLRVVLSCFFACLLHFDWILDIVHFIFGGVLFFRNSLKNFSCSRIQILFFNRSVLRSAFMLSQGRSSSAFSLGLIYLHY